MAGNKKQISPGTRRWINILVLGLAAGFVWRQTMIYRAAAETCITQEQWDNQLSQDHSHCYVKYVRDGNSEVWEPPKDSNSWTHRDTAICGSDVTAIIPASHLADVNKYLNIGARFVGQMGNCASPTATPVPPTPGPTASPNTPVPNVPTATPAQRPSATVEPTSLPTPAPSPTFTPTLDPTPIAVSDEGQGLKKTESAAGGTWIALATKVLAIGTFLMTAGIVILTWLLLLLPRGARTVPTAAPLPDQYTVTKLSASADGKYTWVSLESGTQKLLGLYSLVSPCPEGRFVVKGVMKNYNDKTPYLEISSLTPVP